MHRTGKDRHQIVLIPTCLDDVIGADNPVRLIDAFVDALNLDSCGFSIASSKNTESHMTAKILLENEIILAV